MMKLNDDSTDYCNLWPVCRGKRLQKRREHRVRREAQVMAKLKLAKVGRQMFLGNVYVSPLDAALHVGPERLNGVGVDGAAHVFLGRVVDGRVPVAFGPQ